jgi:hypothetical protein
MKFVHRMQGVRLALLGRDVVYDRGTQRIAKDGSIHTLAKMPVALWVDTDNVEEAHGVLAGLVQETCPNIEWESPRTRVLIDTYFPEWAEAHRVPPEEVRR